MCYLPRTGHTRTPEGCLWPSTGTKSEEALHAQLSATAILRPYGSKSLRKILRARTACPSITHGFPRTWPFNCPRASCDSGINLVAYVVVTCALQVTIVFSFWPQYFRNLYVHMQVPCGPVRMPYEILIRSVVLALQGPCGTHERSERGS